MTQLMTKPAIGSYEDLARLMGLMTGDEKHDLAASSTVDVLWVLYDRVLHVDPGNPGDPDRDRFFLSKGHGPIAYYAVLAAKGFVDETVLTTFAEYESALGWHPDRTLIPGVDISSGSLGHGLPIAVGCALAIRAMNHNGSRVFSLVGDGELDEGSNHEAIALAGRLQLEALHVIAVDNSSSSYGWPGGIEKRFEIEGWDTIRVDGRDHARLETALSRPHPRVPAATVTEIR